MFGLDNTPPPTAATLPGIEVEGYALPHQTTPFDLAVSLREEGDGVRGEIEYASQLFDADTVARFADAFRTLLAAMTQPEPASVDRLALLDAAQRRQLHDWSNPAAAAAAGRISLAAAFRAQARERAGAVAVIDGTRRITYGELDDAAARVAAALRAHGVARGDRVAILAERSAAMIAGQLGILRAGAAYVPLDPAYPAPRIAAMLADCAPAVVLVPQDDTTLPALNMPVLSIDRIAWSGDVVDTDSDDDAPAPDDLAYLIYTSGSTGAPKGVMLEHRNVLPLVVGNHYAAIGPGDCVAYCASPAFDAAAWETWFALLNGASLLVVPQAVLLDPPACARWLADNDVSVLHLTVGLLNQYAAACPEIFPRLRCLLFGGEQADARVVRRLMQSHAPRHWVHCYGPTECTTFATTDPVREPGGGRRLPIGRPLAHASVHILDAAGTPVPIGVAGEIHIGGAAVGRGYWNQPALTAERFVADRFAASADARLYRTGDLGRWLPDGRIEYLGRNDFQFKLRGYRVEPAEIEAAALATGVLREALAIGCRDERGDMRLVLYAVPDGSGDAQPAALRRALAASLPEHLVPSALVLLDAFPLTPHGKIDRNALPPPGFERAGADHVPPQGETETALATLWSELLQLPRVGRDDQFFELGGHSLLVIHLIERLRALGYAAEARMVFAAPVLAALAQQLDAARQSRAARKEIRL
jgi:amino acid adenylation domain-containing protein